MPLDMSVLEGKDPDGRLAELSQKDPTAYLAATSTISQTNLYLKRKRRYESVDDCYIDDPDQVHIYRKNPKWEALRLAELERQKHEEEEQERWKGERVDILQRMENKRNKNKARRLRKKTKTSSRS